MTAAGSTMRRDLIATYAAQAWVAIMGVAFVPVYIRCLGIEAYGLIGLFSTLQFILVILDFGMTPTLTREIARFTGGERTTIEIRDLLRSVEIAAATIGVLAALCLWGAADWLSRSWLRSQTLPDAQVARALTIMGIVSALRFIEGVFRGAMLGLHRQVRFNTIAAVMATLRGVGAVVLLKYVSPTLDAFFVWQGLISIATLGTLAFSTYQVLPHGERAGGFSWAALRSIWRFATGIVGISVLSLLLTQADKVLLSRMLSLADLAHYMLATVVATVLETIVAPLLQAVMPRLSKLHATGDETAFIELYHGAAQMVSVLGGVAGLMLIGFADWIMIAWTGDFGLAAAVAPYIRLLALGYLLNILMWIPYQAQLAYRWTGLTLTINLVAVTVLIPALLWVVPRFGAIGAAAVWVALNAGYVLIGVHLMHRRILRHEKWRWYVRDVMLPLASGGAVIAVARWSCNVPPNGRIAQIAMLGVVALIAVAVSVLSAPLLRKRGLIIARKLVPARI